MRALSIKNLTKTYANGNQALKGIDLVVEAGDFYALLGPNGAGKTTAIGIISSLVNKSGREIGIDAMTEHLDITAALVDQRTDNADRRRLPGAIGSEQRIKIAGLDDEVDALECLVAVRVGLGQVFYGKRAHEAAYCTRAAIAVTPCCPSSYHDPQHALQRPATDRRRPGACHIAASGLVSASPAGRIAATCAVAAAWRCHRSAASDEQHDLGHRIAARSGRRGRRLG